MSDKPTCDCARTWALGHSPACPWALRQNGWMGTGVPDEQKERAAPDHIRVLSALSGHPTDADVERACETIWKADDRLGYLGWSEFDPSARNRLRPYVRQALDQFATGIEKRALGEREASHERHSRGRA